MIMLLLCANDVGGAALRTDVLLSLLPSGVPSVVSRKDSGPLMEAQQIFSAICSRRRRIVKRAEPSSGRHTQKASERNKNG